METQDSQTQENQKIFDKAKQCLPDLKNLFSEVSSEWGYEDAIYRFYHYSFKVYGIQAMTEKIVEGLQRLAPHRPLNSDFQKIIKEGTGHTFALSHNRNWLAHTRPMLEAFFHARYMLEMICKYTEELEEPPDLLPSGWAAVLHLYNLR
ncbi:hypothetical protein FBR05_03180 [Deltaproteobacteria bacterium PRO3]|nr:hypothetical protein [Deltaproteobacteria bacterium PRO3]